MEEASILDIGRKFIESDDIKSYEYNEYLPTSGSNLNIPGTITIHIECQDEFYHPRRSYLLIEGDLLKKADETRFDGENITLSNNGIWHLFSNFKYELGGTEIENINNPGVAGVMMGLAKFPYTFAVGTGMAQCWAPETMDTTWADRAFQKRKEYILTKSEPKGSFSFILELENQSGFVEDYDTVLYGMRHKITLVRKGDDDAILKAPNGVEDGKIKLTKIAWIMPRVHASDVKKFALYRMIENKDVFDVAFRMRQCNVAEIPKDVTTFDWRLGVRSLPEKPRHIIIALQHNRRGKQQSNPSLFDHADLSQVSVVLNDTKYPARDIICDFKKHKYVEYYKMFVDFSREYYGLDPLTVGNWVDIITYKEEYPIFYIDVSKQSERLNQGVVDIVLRLRFSKETPEGLQAHALVISDRRMKFQSDGRKMNIIQ